MLRSFACVVFLALGSAPVSAGCPIGSFAWIDDWGNKICKRFDDGSTATTQSNSYNAGGCPTGTHPWVDSWGTKICQSFESQGQPTQQLYNTSRGCPLGTFSWTDNWGNSVCKSF